MEVYPSRGILPVEIQSQHQKKSINQNMEEDVPKMSTVVSNNTGINLKVAAALVRGTPANFFSLFVNNKLLQIMIDQTNLFATQKLDDVSENGRFRAQTPTNKDEMK
ncbi:hypothetical protein ILUMI_17374 [Ignelater luminosus]|uniref:Uncharacterized protein n=1 Tax=Ignelater luminosus TaxID=2038154 RepID=A0A8K0CLU2_IGNLU|nr:hypothetical protein ILUMI_17374 [Ignelater luminosus]